MAKKITVKVTDTKTEKTKKDNLKELLSIKVYKLFDREPVGSVVSSQLESLAEEILNLK